MEVNPIYGSVQDLVGQRIALSRRHPTQCESKINYL